MNDKKISSRASRIIQLFFFGILFILFRSWYLSTVQKEQGEQQAHRPQRRSVLERAERATIRDRDNVPLAINKMQYNASICYGPIRQLPTISWERDAQGNLCKIYPRKQHILKLAQMLASELHLDPQDIEDLIHAKCALFPHIPFVIKEKLDEATYFRLKMREKDFPGLCAERTSTRVYPWKKTGCDVIGYLGAISSEQYLAISEEIRTLETYLSEREEGKMAILPKGFFTPLEVRARLKELQEKAYGITDLVGKSGIEAVCDHVLRGVHGKKNFEVDIKGNILRELPGSRPAVNGHRVLLTISAELQSHAEKLLAEYEIQQDLRDQPKSYERAHPLQRGSALVALDPNTGEVLAFASSPRFDPNDFIPSGEPAEKRKKAKNILQWLENSSYIAAIWEGKNTLKREVFSTDRQEFYEETIALSWPLYLDSVVGKKSAIRAVIEKIHDIKTAYTIQQELEILLSSSKQNNMEQLFELLNQDAHAFHEQRKVFDEFFAPIFFVEDQLLTLDILRLLVDKTFFSLSLIEQIGTMSLSHFFELSQSFQRAQTFVKAIAEQIYKRNEFQTWRKEHFKQFLNEKRAEEAEQKKWARSYTDYLHQIQQKMFDEFWQTHRLPYLYAFLVENPAENVYPELLTLKKEWAEKTLFVHTWKSLFEKVPPAIGLELLQVFRSFKQLDQPLLYNYALLRKPHDKPIQADLASAFYPTGGFGYNRSFAYRQATPLGSIFKIICSYQALIEKMESLKDENLSSWPALNPFIVNDDLAPGSGRNPKILGHFENGEPIHRIYRGGRLPKSSYPNIGKIDLIQAIERSSNIYFSLLAGDFLKDSNSLLSASRLFGLGEKTGIELADEFPGKLPTDLANNKTGLYSFAIGQHSLLATPLQTAVFLASLANGGHIVKPHLIRMVAGPGRFEMENTPTEFPLRKDLELVGIHFPLFTSLLSKWGDPTIWQTPLEIKRSILLPKKVKEILFEAMHRVINSQRGTGRISSVPFSIHNPQTYESYVRIGPQMIGKTSTAQILYKSTIDRFSKPVMNQHVWFGGISFTDTSLTRPELVVVVFLRFADAGRDAAPLAAYIAEKWHEIRKSK